MNQKCLIFLFFFFSKLLSGQTLSSGEILYRMERLNTLGSVLYIAAHPDDENTRMLSWLSKDKKLRSAYLSLTRGEGGQNLIGSEKGSMLGLIRTHELFEARKIDGVTQFFTRAVDFGYSKNPEETLQKWNRDSVLSDVVRFIRYFKPDVIICRFPTTGEGGHGHHTASAILAAEAFRAAADPAQFPEQVKEFGTWHTKKLFWNTYQFGNNNTTSPSQRKVNVGVPFPLSGQSTGEIAAASRSMHKSQGFGTAGVPGEITEYLKPLLGDTSGTGLFDNLDFSWKRIRGAGKIAKAVQHCIKRYDPAHPEKSVPALCRIVRQVEQIPVQNEEVRLWKQVKMNELNEIILAAAGIRIDALLSEPVMVAGKDYQLRIRLINRSHLNAELEKISFPDGRDTLTTLQLPYNVQQELKHFFRPSASQRLSNPYWLEQTEQNNLYRIADKQDMLDNGASKRIACELMLSVNRIRIPFRTTLQYQSTDPVKGEQYRDVELLPEATVSFDHPLHLLRLGQDTIHFTLTVEANTPSYSGKLRLKVPESFVLPESYDVSLQQTGERQSFLFSVVCQQGMQDLSATAMLQSVSGQQETALSIQRAEYSHLPPLHLLSQASSRIVRSDFRPQPQPVAYIPGSGDDIPTVLAELGYPVTTIPAEQLEYTDLSPYRIIITGVRAYNLSEYPGLQHEKLMQFVSNGGNLIVQYNTNNRIGPLKSKIGPYPFEITRDRVTDEHSPVKMLLPEHPVFHTPHRITPDDFNDWVQERGIYFAANCDQRYQKPLGFSDPGEEMLDGSLIVAPYGKGHFVYTGIAFFRQLPAGVPGAIRLFLNLMHLPHEK